MAAMLVIPEGGKIRVIGGPVERIRGGGHDDEDDERKADALYFSQQRILQRCEQCTGHDHAAQAPSHAQADDGRTDDEPPEHNERDHEQRTRDRKTRSEEIDREECAAARHRDRV
jgi:hypothetical protein